MPKTVEKGFFQTVLDIKKGRKPEAPAEGLGF